VWEGGQSPEMWRWGGLGEDSLPALAHCLIIAHYQVIVCTVQRGTPNHMERIAQHLPITVAGSGDRFGIDAAEHLTRSQRLYRSLSPVDRRLDNAEVWGAEMSCACPDMNGILPPHTRCCQLHRLRHRCRLTSRSAFSWPCPV